MPLSTTFDEELGTTTVLEDEVPVELEDPPGLSGFEEELVSTDPSEEDEVLGSIFWELEEPVLLSEDVPTGVTFKLEHESNPVINAKLKKACFLFIVGLLFKVKFT